MQGRSLRSVHLPCTELGNPDSGRRICLHNARAMHPRLDQRLPPVDARGQSKGALRLRNAASEDARRAHPERESIREIHTPADRDLHGSRIQVEIQTVEGSCLQLELRCCGHSRKSKREDREQYTHEGTTAIETIRPPS